MDNYIIYSYNDYISQMFENMPENEFNKWLKIFNKYIKALKSSSFDVCIMQMDVDDSFEYAPRNVFSDFDYTDVDTNARLYCMEDNCVLDEVFGNYSALWFKNESDANAYIKMIKSDEVK